MVTMWVVVPCCKQLGDDEDPRTTFGDQMQWEGNKNRAFDVVLLYCRDLITRFLRMLRVFSVPTDMSKRCPSIGGRG
jgi:hypothetical protein